MFPIREDVRGLVSKAPDFLRRTDIAVVVRPYGSYSLGSNRFSGRIPEGSIEVLSKLASSIQRGQTEVASVTAREVLEIALNTAKPHWDYDGWWFLDFPQNFCGFVSGRLFNEDGTSIYYHQGKADFLKDKAREWREGLLHAMSDNSLFEAGLIFQYGREKAAVLSVAFPHDGTTYPWYKRLSPRELLVGSLREEVERLRFDLTGETLEEGRLKKLRGQIFNPDSTEPWWGEAVRINQIATGRVEEVRKVTRPTFSEAVTVIMAERVRGINIRDMATFDDASVNGYWVRASSFVSPKIVNLTLIVDDNNWVDNRRAEKAGY